MGIQVLWDTQEFDILIFDLRAEWTWGEFHACVEEAMRMIHDCSHTIYAIVLPPTTFPASPSIITEFQRVTRMLLPSIALIVVVTNSFLVETVNEIFFRVSPLAGRIGRLAKTMDDARQLIASHRAQRDAAC
jgi:hypothetical protein